MSVIQNDDNIKSKGSQRKSVYEIPAVIRDENNEISFEKALIAAIIFHPVLIAFILLVSFVLKLLGIDFDLLKKPDLKPKDIEFVLVEKEAPPIDKNTKYRADRNSRAGGKHDPKRKVSIPQPPAPKADDKKPSAPKTQTKQPVKPQPKVSQPKTQNVQPKPQQPVQMPKLEPPKPKAPAPKPTPAPVAPKPVSVPKSDFNIPIPTHSIPKMPQMTTAPVTSSPVGPSSTSQTARPSTPAPSFSPTAPGRNSGGYGGTTPGDGRFSKQNGTGNNNGNAGNPGPGNPKGAPGIDAIKEPDFGPYMKELQRRIKMNWDPPKGNESKRVILLFKISKDGRLLSVNVHKSSGLPEADNAAINAVKLTAPFKPLPPEFKGNSVDIQFTFDYNVLGASMY